jgi:serine/threonine-protein kinase RsbW
VASDASTPDDRTPWVEKVLPTRLDAIRETEHELHARLLELGYGAEEWFAVRLAAEEAIVNAMKHGNRMDPGRRVCVAYRVSSDRAELRITDEGGGFDPCCIPDPTADENLQKPCGRGIMLMRSYMDEVRFNPAGTEVHMVKFRRAKKASAPGAGPGGSD